MGSKLFGQDTVSIDILLQQQELCIDDNIFSQLFPFIPEIYSKCDYKIDHKFLKVNDYSKVIFENMAGKLLEISLTLTDDKVSTIV